MALATVLRRALPLAIRSPEILQVAAISATNILCRRNQRLTPHFSRVIGVSRIQQLSSTAIAEEASADKYLIGALEEEIDKAREVPPSFPFKIIQDEPGSSLVVLQRTTSGGEVVTIMSDIGGISETGGLDLRLVATVTKPNGQHLEFIIRYCPDILKFVISSVAYSVSPAPYQQYLAFSVGLISDKEFQKELEGIEIRTGIKLSGLSYKAFHKYLEARGIEPRTTLRFLFSYMKNKRDRACSTWFNKLSNFMAN